MEWYIKVLKQYADFKGRARRKEFWMFSLFDSIFLLSAMVIDYAFIEYTLEMYCNDIYYNDADVFPGFFEVLYSLALVIPGLAVTVRRLHDVGHSGWLLLIIFIPIIGWIWLFVLLCTDSQTGENKWGTNPKEILNMSV